MIQRFIIKNKAKQQLKGKLLLSIAVLVLAQVLSNLDLFTPEFLANINLLSPEFYSIDTKEPSRIFTILRIISFLLTGVMSVSAAGYCLNIINNKEEARFSDILSGFSVYIKSLGLHIILTLAVMLGTIVFIVPGIIISLMFSQSYYILSEDNDKSIIQCLIESNEMMKGHKLELFILQLSFVGWLMLVVGLLVTAVIWVESLSLIVSVILVISALGIAGGWIEPYMQMTFTNYYVELKSESNDNSQGNW